jgi:hypothetical protein
VGRRQATGAGGGCVHAKPPVSWGGFPLEAKSTRLREARS